jgi:hypothetical protein
MRRRETKIIYFESIRDTDRKEKEEKESCREI